MAGEAGRRTFVCVFPREVSHEDVLNFLRSVGGLPPPQAFRKAQCIIFEMYGDAYGIRHFLSVPDHVATDVVGLMRTHIPGTNIQELDHGSDPLAAVTWDRVAEIGMSSGSTPIRVKSPRGAISTLLTHFSNLSAGHAILLQWVISPAKSQSTQSRGSGQPSSKLDKSRLAEKFSDSTFIATGRISSRGANARGQIQQVYNSLAATHTHGVKFRSLMGRQKAMLHRTQNRAVPLTFHCRLNAMELSVLLGIPFGIPHISGLPQGHTIQLAPDPIIPRVGRRIFESDYAGIRRPLALSPIDRASHMIVVGPNNSGKSTLLENMILADIRDGSGVAYIDPKGDSVQRVLNAIPSERLGDVLLFDVTDGEHPIGFNVLAGERPDRTAGQLMTVFDKLFDLTSNTPRATDVLRSALMTLAERGCTVIEVPLALEPGVRGDAFRRALVTGVTNPELVNFWEWFIKAGAREQADIAAPIVRRLRPLLLYPELRLTFGQAGSGLDLRAAITQNKIILVPLNSAQLHEEAKLVGTLFLNQLWNAVRVEPLSEEFFLYIDEFKEVMNLPMSFGDMFAQARGYRLPITVATQDVGRLGNDMRRDVMTNARTKIVFQPASSDARLLAAEMGQTVSEHDLMNLGRREVMARFHVGGYVTGPVTGHTYPPVPPVGLGEAARIASRTQYSRPRLEVDAEINARLRAMGAQPKPPGSPGTGGQTDSTSPQVTGWEAWDEPS
ncbi:type IV secretory system conjugative DNA transfer family protein [Streptomyces sp. So13.3]|uniref:type IV secretory system conjugative DNA transfer family protein n=1 Tax=Streptomyces sp. So13.3 TaxID=2136173 RepID=UPI001107350A|nr:type IV secretory system conjugative DNA transfer family protein [Streptomyces sp. So13.3]QNA75401.1 type IV secretory system conjugative DNA transfer family protein [Streptomyces sp. So13.3]